MDDAAKRTHARKLNMARRHLNQEQRRGLIQAELKDRPHVSDRQIAKALGVGHPTVSATRKDLEEKSELVKFTSSIGADGKERPRQVERKAPEPELPIIPARPISIPVAKPEQVAKVAAQAQSVISPPARVGLTPVNLLVKSVRYSLPRACGADPCIA